SEHQQRLGHQGQPVADLGDELAGEEQAEVPDGQGTERVGGGEAETGHRPSRPWAVRSSRTSRAPARRRCWSGLSSRIRAVSQAVLRRRDSASRDAPSGETATQAMRRAAGSGVRTTRLWASSLVTTLVVGGGL